MSAIYSTNLQPPFLITLFNLKKEAVFRINQTFVPLSLILLINWKVREICLDRHF